MSAAADAAWKDRGETSALEAFEAKDIAQAVQDASSRNQIKAEVDVRFNLKRDWPVTVELIHPRDQAEVDLVLDLMGLSTRFPEQLEDDRARWQRWPARLTVTYPRGDKAWRWAA